ncbi:MAG TPA: plastocyanin/azurin family copper-binding protein [Intrasporangium sp.]|nr:plastocyanin/azurin family copper-binding protein [Intrasporangium sp.]
MTRSLRLRVLLAALAAIAAAIGLTAASPTSARAQTGATWTVQVGSESPNHSLQGMNFGPDEVWINVGDTVHWVAKSMEIHTVSFVNAEHPLADFFPGTPQFAYEAFATPESTISAPGEFRNSGIMATMPIDTLPAPTVTSYHLTFTGPGDYTYYCYVHGAMMRGEVHVRPAGTPYPHTQQWYTAQASKDRAAVIADLERLRSRVQSAASAHHVFVGASDDMGFVMRFIRETVTVHVGESVTFDLGRNAVPVPHTVTFGPDPANPFPPVGDPTHYAGGTLSSGVLLPPATFKVTFTKAGTYDYRCLLHDDMGMVGTVNVVS